MPRRDADSNKVTKLIQEIPNPKSHLVKVLEKLANQFQFDEITELLSGGVEINYDTRSRR